MFFSPGAYYILWCSAFKVLTYIVRLHKKVYYTKWIHNSVFSTIPLYWLFDIPLTHNTDRKGITALLTTYTETLNVTGRYRFVHGRHLSSKPCNSVHNNTNPNRTNNKNLNRVRKCILVVQVPCYSPLHG
jgi:hypothetical protein